MAKKKQSRGSKAGERMADAIIEFCHLMYQRQTAQRVLRGVRNRLRDRFSEFDKKQPGYGREACNWEKGEDDG